MHPASQTSIPLTWKIEWNDYFKKHNNVDLTINEIEIVNIKLLNTFEKQDLQDRSKTTA